MKSKIHKSPKNNFISMSKKLIYFFLLLHVSFISNAQITNDSLAKRDAMIEANDTIVPLEEVVVYRHKWNAAEKKEFQLLQNRVYKVYPIAKIAADRLTVMNRNMDKMKTNREKKKYFKIVENYMENEFTGQLKKLSRKQGQILVKLIHRQTGYTTFELIKDYKSGWKAFWSNNTAKLFDINLKTKYAPYQVNEDFLIESILDQAFVRGRLVNQKTANPIDIDELFDYWEKKAKELKK